MGATDLSVLPQRQVVFPETVFQGTTTTETPLVVQGLVGQASSLFRIFDSDGVELAAVGASGLIRTNRGFQQYGVSPSTPGLVLRGAVSQTANLTEWQNSAGTAMAYMTNAGGLVTEAVAIFKTTPGVKGLTVRAAAAQTANLTEWQTSDGTIISRVNNHGNLIINRLSVRESDLNSVFTVANSGEPSTPAVRIIAAPAQTASFIEFLNSAATAISWVNSSGRYMSYYHDGWDAFTNGGIEVTSSTQSGGRASTTYHIPSATAQQLGCDVNGLRTFSQGGVSATTGFAAFRASSFTQASSREDKLEIQTFSVEGPPSELRGSTTRGSVLERAKRLRPVSYKRPVDARMDGKEYQPVLHSFIAEETAEVMPEITAFDVEGNPMGIDIAALGTVTFSLVQNLLKRIEDLEARLA